MKALELHKLAYDTGTGFTAEDIVEGWSSLIWTPRFTPADEFELRTAKIQETRGILPEGSFVKVRDSKTVMAVETHNIENNELVIKGRSLETILETRAIFTGAASNPVTHGSLNIVYKLIVDAIGSGTTYDSDQIPHVLAGLPVVTSRPAQIDYTRPPGDVYTRVLDYLTNAGAGIQARLEGENVLLIPYIGNDRRFDIEYPVDPIHLSVSTGTLSNPKYLFSNIDYRNVAYLTSPLGFRVVFGNGGAPGVSGFDRRVLQVDASDLAADGITDPGYLMDARGELELAKHNKIQIIEAGISELAKYTFVDREFFGYQDSPAAPSLGKTYSLGDMLTIVGDYGIKADVRVTEFIRIHDKDGYREVPTLSLIE